MTAKEKFPKYQTGSEYWETAHNIRNADMTLLYQFFNPDLDQVCVSASSTVRGRVVPDFLEAMGYEVEWDGDRWTAYIPVKFRVKMVQVMVEKRW